MTKNNLMQSLASKALKRLPSRASVRKSFALLSTTSPETKIAQRRLYHYYRELALRGEVPPLSDTGFRCFSQFEEDGKLLFILAMLNVASGKVLDVGAADGIRSNCANLLLNFGWCGALIEGDLDNVRRGREFYSKHPDTWAYPPEFIHAMVTRENINDLVRKTSLPAEIDLLSIDIDGNDYWVWDALEEVVPKVVIIETHVEFGLRSIVVPYDKDYVYPGKHPDYHGASPVAMAKLAIRKGYRLVGANQYGFNTIYVRRGMAEDLLPEVSVESILSHPRNRERQARFEPIKDWEYLEV